jgi:hypothetical protein
MAVRKRACCLRCAPALRRDACVPQLLSVVRLLLGRAEAALSALGPPAGGAGAGHQEAGGGGGDSSPHRPPSSPFRLTQETESVHATSEHLLPVDNCAAASDQLPACLGAVKVRQTAKSTVTCVAHKCFLLPTWVC